MQFPDARILIFAKAPQAGRVKTRLVPLLGEQGACDFHAHCLRQAVAARCAARLAPVLLYVTPDVHHPLFSELCERYPVQLRVQHGSDLGERMNNAAIESLAEASAVLLTGTDAPALSDRQLHEALSKLSAGSDVAIQAAEDGGYVMLGLRAAQPALFTDIPWGGDEVARLTRERCHASGLALFELPLGWDIDRPRDLQRLAGMEGFEAYQHLPRL